jgi:hypothetical protein
MSAQRNSRLRADRVITNLFRETDVRPRANGRVEQAAYATRARRFLDVSQAYLSLQYTGSRHWYPNGRIFTTPSAGSRLPVPLFKQGEKHVVR